jgi:hypothetical protein
MVESGKMASEKVFPYLLNKAAFVDTIRMSVWSDEKPIPDQLLDAKNDGILSGKPLYARRLSGRTPLTGNPVRILYGKVSRFERVPSCRVDMRSEDVPLTGSQVNETIRLLLPAATRIQPKLVELTFDLTKTSVGYLHRHMIHGARQWDEVADGWGRRTVYIGSPKSPWQVRIYDKTERVVRLELILRRGFLPGYGILQPDKILTLRSLKLQTMFSLRRFSRPRVAVATNSWNDQYWQDVACNWERNGSSLQSLCRMLVGRGDKTGRLFPFARLQQTLERMQANLIW